LEVPKEYRCDNFDTRKHRSNLWLSISSNTTKKSRIFWHLIDTSNNSKAPHFYLILIHAISCKHYITLYTHSTLSFVLFHHSRHSCYNVLTQSPHCNILCQHGQKLYRYDFKEHWTELFKFQKSYILLFTLYRTNLSENNDCLEHILVQYKFIISINAK
jgi:hypothetical protein